MNATTTGGSLRFREHTASITHSGPSVAAVEVTTRLQRSLLRFREHRFVVLAILLLLNVLALWPRSSSGAAALRLRGAVPSNTQCAACPLHVAAAPGFRTLGRTVIAETAHARIERHRVVLPRATHGNAALAAWEGENEEHHHPDHSNLERVDASWLWVAMPDSVEVLVEIEENEFLILNQTKYGLRGYALALAGGSCRVEEKPSAAAQRKLRSEMGLECDEWVRLGAPRGARTLGSRGGAAVFSFLAQECHVVVAVRDHPRTGVRATYVPTDAEEVEPQSLLRLSGIELRTAYEAGEFGEASASNTVGLAILLLLQHNFERGRAARERNSSPLNPAAATARGGGGNSSSLQNASTSSAEGAGAGGDADGAEEEEAPRGDGPYTPSTSNDDPDGRATYKAYQRDMKAGRVVAPMRMSHVGSTGKMRRIGCFFEWCEMDWVGKPFVQKKRRGADGKLYTVIGKSGGSIGTIDGVMNPLDGSLDKF